MSLPQPFPGLVIRYNYLWADDAAQGHEEGDKDRPAAIVMVVKHSGGDETHVYALPITHSAPIAGTEALEIPAAVCRAAGLDAARSWVVLSEFNEFVWPGFDLRIIPGRAASHDGVWVPALRISSRRCGTAGSRLTRPGNRKGLGATFDFTISLAAESFGCVFSSKRIPVCVFQSGARRPRAASKSHPQVVSVGFWEDSAMPPIRPRLSV